MVQTSFTIFAWFLGVWIGSGLLRLPYDLRQREYLDVQSSTWTFIKGTLYFEALFGPVPTYWQLRVWLRRRNIC